MQRTTYKSEALSVQMKRKASKPAEEVEKTNPGNFDLITSTGSTLLDLAISGNKVRGGGFPAGIVVEASGPSQSGKTALLCEIAGNILRKKGQTHFHDPEARLDDEFSSLFGAKIPAEDYFVPDLITEVFADVRKWEPKDINVVNGIFGDSLAALSTKLEMEEEEGDKMGMRRAKEFSEGLRKHCRIIKQKNLLFVCSNQVRHNSEAINKWSPKYSIPGGMAFSFYSTVRLKFGNPEKIYKEVEFKGKKLKEVVGIETEVEVIKTADTPYRKAPVIILYGYGIDDIRANLEYIKKYKGQTTYCLNGASINTSLEKAIRLIEGDAALVKRLKEETIDLWEEIRDKFATDRKKIR